MRMIILGNMVSAIAAVFLCGSCISSDMKKSYSCQMLESIFLAVSSVFLGAGIRLITQILGAVRNGLVLKGRYNKTSTILFIALTLALGLAFNQEGLIGLIPVAASVQLTACNYFCKNKDAVKASFIINTALWGIYSVFICDYVYAISNAVIVLAGISSYFAAPAKHAKA